MNSELFAQLPALRTRIESELIDGILPWWLKHTVDHQKGGFHGEVDGRLKVMEDAPKGSVLNTRILWTFSAAYRKYRSLEYLEAATRAFDWIQSALVDPVYNGLYWTATANGKPDNPKKQIYAQAFAIYGLSEYYRACGSKEALSMARAIFRLVEKHGRDDEYGGYVEACQQNWSATNEMRLSPKDRNDPKSMNTHLHVLEAYANLYRCWPDASLREALVSLIRIFIDHIIDSKTAHFHLFFGENWEVRSDVTSFGHDIEGSWLLLEAAEMIESKALLDELEPIALRMVDATLEEGMDDDHGIISDAYGGGKKNTEKEWWSQAEGAVGCLNAYQISGNEKYLKATKDIWEFLEQYIVDHNEGEWFYMITQDRQPIHRYMKAGLWKCPYHNSRACLELMRRIDEIMG